METSSGKSLDTLYIVPQYATGIQVGDVDFTLFDLQQTRIDSASQFNFLDISQAKKLYPIQLNAFKTSTPIFTTTVSLLSTTNFLTTSSPPSFFTAALPFFPISPGAFTKFPTTTIPLCRTSSFSSPHKPNTFLT